MRWASGRWNGSAGATGNSRTATEPGNGDWRPRCNSRRSSIWSARSSSALPISRSSSCWWACSAHCGAMFGGPNRLRGKRDSNGRGSHCRPNPANLTCPVESGRRVCPDPILHHRRDTLAPLAAVEDAVVADILGEVVLLLLVGQVRSQIERGTGLADTGNVVALTFDREKGGVADGVGVDRLAAVN